MLFIITSILILHNFHNFYIFYEFYYNYAFSNVIFPIFPLLKSSKIIFAVFSSSMSPPEITAPRFLPILCNISNAFSFSSKLLSSKTCLTSSVSNLYLSINSFKLFFNVRLF